MEIMMELTENKRVVKLAETQYPADRHALQMQMLEKHIKDVRWFMEDIMACTTERQFQVRSRAVAKAIAGLSHCANDVLIIRSMDDKVSVTNITFTKVSECEAGESS